MTRPAWAPEPNPVVLHYLDTLKKVLADQVAKLEETKELIANVEKEVDPTCPLCKHPFSNHDAEIGPLNEWDSQKQRNTGRRMTVYECNHYAGMGDWCGCKEGGRPTVYEENNA